MAKISTSFFEEFNLKLLAAETRNQCLNNSIQILKEDFYDYVFIVMKNIISTESLLTTTQDSVDINNSTGAELIAGKDLKLISSHLANSCKDVYLTNSESEPQFINFSSVNKYKNADLSFTNQTCDYRDRQDFKVTCSQICGGSKRNKKEKLIFIDSLTTNKSIDLNSNLNSGQSNFYSIPKHKRLNMSMIPSSTSFLQRDNIKSSKGASISISNTSLNLSTKSSKIKLACINRELDVQPIKKQLNSPLMSISSTYRTNSSKMSMIDGTSQSAIEISSKSINNKSTKPNVTKCLHETSHTPQSNKIKQNNSNYEVTADLTKNGSLTDFFQSKQKNSTFFMNKPCYPQPQISIEVLEVDLKTIKDFKTKESVSSNKHGIKESSLNSNHILHTQSEGKLKRSSTFFQGMKSNKQSRLIECVKTINKSHHTDQFINHLGEIFNMKNIEIDLQSIGKSNKSNNSNFSG